MPMGRQSHRHHRQHSSKHRRKAERMPAGSGAQEDMDTESTEHHTVRTTNSSDKSSIRV